jgi:hypothetical protein
VLGEEVRVRRSAGVARRCGVLLAGLAAVAACSGPTPTGLNPAGSTRAGATAAPTSLVQTPPSSPAPSPVAAPSGAAALAAPCPTGWGSQPEAEPDLGPAPLHTVLTGSDSCADRIEFEVDGPAAGYSVQYVDEVVQDGSGAPVTVPGGARLQVQLHHPAYTDAGQSTFAGRIGEPLPSVSGYRSVQSVVFAGSFEGYSTFGVGVRARLPFRVSVVKGPGTKSRIVLKLAHSWT